MSRTLQTADVIGAALGLKPVPLDGLREMDFGWAEGKLLAHLHGQGSGIKLYSYFARLAMATTAERPNRFAARVKSALEAILRCASAFRRWKRRSCNGGAER